jgi:hypothetical protein
MHLTMKIKTVSKKSTLKNTYIWVIFKHYSKLYISWMQDIYGCLNFRHVPMHGYKIYGFLNFRHPYILYPDIGVSEIQTPLYVWMQDIRVFEFPTPLYVWIQNIGVSEIQTPVYCGFR